MESRLVLDGLPLADYSAVSPAWFEAVPLWTTQPQSSFVGPLAAAAGESSGATSLPESASASGGDQWIVRLTEPATRLAGTVQGAERLLDAPGVDFQVIRGLGLPGQVLVGSTLNPAEAEAQLACNPRVAHFERDVTVYAQVTPNDPQFSTLTGLHNVGVYGAADADINAPEAWNIAASDPQEWRTGSTNVVVGVVDSGVDVTHPDLYANIWINQGEIPATLAVQGQIDRDGDGLITFYDLNDSANAAYVRDFNGNGYIDADDLLRDIRWADRFDTDQNGFVDDLFGWDFRQAAEGYIARNLPSDANGHGTHVAGTIGAMGNNGEGVVGVNWRTSLMVLKVLDENNSGFTSDAVQAINYATMMRTRSKAPVNVRVLNNSWGQSGAYSPNLEAAIQAAGEAEILLVAAAGNGNILGQGLDNDEFPFYPASYELDNVISVAASDRSDRLAGFSNYGATSVDIAAPGVGVLSTLPDGKYGSLQGTSMAAPHVSGVAALVWSQVPWATVGEVREAVLGSAQRGDPGNPNDPLHALTGRLSSGGRLRAHDALTAEVFAPLPELISAADITSQGSTSQTITVRYTDAVGLDEDDDENESTLDDSDLVVRRLWGPSETLAVDFVSVAPPTIGRHGERIYEATYELPAPGDVWDAPDYGPYEIVLQANQVKNTLGLAAPQRTLGEFRVHIDDPTVIYVNSFDDANVGDGIADAGAGRRTLRAAIQEANAAGAPRTIILEPGTYKLTVPGTEEDAAATGDLDVTGNLTILGAQAESTVIDAAGIDRVLDVRPGGSLRLERVTVSGGSTTGDGGGILNHHTLVLVESKITWNSAYDGGGVRSVNGSYVFLDHSQIAANAAKNDGGGVHVTEADVLIEGTSIEDNRASTHDPTVFDGINGEGGGVYVGGGQFTMSRSTVSGNIAFDGGGLNIAFDPDARITNSTISGNYANSVTLYTGYGLGSAGGIVSRTETQTLLTNVTVTQNHSFYDGITGAFRLRNTLIAGNVVGGDDVDGAWVTSDGHNLIGKTGWAWVFTAPGDQITELGADYLGPLGDNGGPTKTHPLLPGSPAIDGGDSSVVVENSGVGNKDQRYTLRQADGDGDGIPQVDIGAFEANSALVRGIVFNDSDGDRSQDPDEPGIGGRTVYVDLDGNGQLNWGEPTAITSQDDPLTVTDSEAGRYAFTNLAPGTYQIAQVPETSWRQTVAGPGQIEVVSRTWDGGMANGMQTDVSISGEGRFVAFTSYATNLVPEGGSGNQDIFVYDRQNDTVERVYLTADPYLWSDSPAISEDGRFVAFHTVGWSFSHVYLYDRWDRSTILVSESPTGEPGDGGNSWPSISGDGRYVAFSSTATNLTPGASSGHADVLVYDRTTELSARISVAPGGAKADADSTAPSISRDGSHVVFYSSASNLVPGDSGLFGDVFVWDRDDQSIRRVSVARDGSEGNADTWTNPTGGGLSISGDGSYVAFSSKASNLVPNDENGVVDVFVCDLRSEPPTIERISIGDNEKEGNGDSIMPSISADGRYVAFRSFADNLVPGDTNGSPDVFVFDRKYGTIERISLAADGSQPNGLDNWIVGLDLSDDGRYVAFLSDASSLAPQDRTGSIGVFVRSTAGAAEAPSFSVDLFAGQVLSEVDFGTQALAGRIAGRHFDDLNANGIREWWEPGLPGWTVYLDLDQNGKWDVPEPTAVTDDRGEYSFTAIATMREYTVALAPQTGWTQTAPGRGDAAAWRVYVGPAEQVTNRDFGSRQDQTTGQTGTAMIEGTVFRDVKDDGTYHGNEPGVAGERVFLDVNDNGALDYDEPYQDTAADGRYAFANLGNRTYAVRLVGDAAYEQSFPQGNQLSKQDYTFAGPKERIERAGDVFVGDLNGDGEPDLVVARPTTDNVSIWLNDGHGNFPAPATTLHLYPDALGPVAIAGGYFNDNTLPDLAIADQLNSKVTVLLDFQNDVQNPHFASITTVAVGAEPRAIAVGDLTGDGHVDLAVANEGEASVSILRNNGAGTFAWTGVNLPTGNSPVAIIAADFDRDDDLDLAVANFGDQPKGTDRGQVSILLNEGGGSFAECVDYLAGSGPTGLVSDDFDQDGHVDVAVSSLVSNNATLLRGKGDGSFYEGLALAAGTQPNDIAAADTDGDDDIDLIVANGGGNNISLLRNQKSQGAFGFEPPENYGVALLAGGQLPLATGDLNGDGLVDFAVAGTAHGRVTILRNQLTAGAHRVALTGSGTVQRDFALRPINKPPTFSGLPTSLVQLNEDAPLQTVTLTGISAGGTETQDLRITMTSSNPAVIPIPTYTFVSPATELTLQYGPVADRSGTAVITVTVMDAGLDGDLDTPADNAETSGSFTVTVQPLNDPPTLDPIADRPAIKEGESPAPVTLTGIGAGGGEDQQVRVQAASTNAALVAGVTVDYAWPANTATLTYTLQANASGSAVITVTVTDAGLDNIWATTGDNLSFSQSFGVTVNPVNASPTLAPIPNPPAIDEDTTQVQTVSLTGITAGTGESQRLRVVATSDAPGLIPDPTVSYTSPATTGQLSYTPLAEQNGTANITVTVVDGGPDDDPDTNDGNGSFSRVFAVTVRAVEDRPRMAVGQMFRVDEQAPNNTLVGTVLATDPDAGDTLSYAITAGNDGNAFAIDATSGAIRVATPAALDFEARPQFLLTVRAEDGTGRRDEASVRIDLNDVNDAPVANHDNVETQENQALDIPWVTLFANDSDVDSPQTQWSVVNVAAEANGTAVNDPANRRIRFTPDTDFRGRASFVYTLDDGAGLRDDAAVVVRVSVANHPPTDLTLSNAVIAENIGTSTAALVGTLSAADPDAGDRHVFALVMGDGDVDNGLFQIADDRLEIKAGVAVDYETQRQYSIRIQASDGLATFQKPLTIAVTDVNEFAPVIDAQTLHVAELSVYGASVGTVVAQDGDRWQTLRFAIAGGNASGAFGILPDTGQIVVTDGSQLDYETQATYTLTVTVSDSGQPQRTGTGTVTVMVDDVNEAPIFLSVRERVEGEYVDDFAAADPDAGDTLHLTIRNDERFEVTADGRLKLKAGASLDRQEAAAVNLQITATDGGQPPLSRTQAFVIQVLANPHPWQNPVRANDVTRDGLVQPQDVLRLINEINGRLAGHPRLPATRPAGASYLDPNGDDALTAADVLRVINEINGRATAGEGEPAVPPSALRMAGGPEAISLAATENAGLEDGAAGPAGRSRIRTEPSPGFRHRGASAPRLQLGSRPNATATEEVFAERDAVVGEWDALLQLLAEQTVRDAT